MLLIYFCRALYWQIASCRILWLPFPRFMPCMHFQTDGRLFRSYEPWLECDESHLLTRALIGTTALLIGNSDWAWFMDVVNSASTWLVCAGARRVAGFLGVV